MAARSSGATIGSCCRSRPSPGSTRNIAPTSTITAASTCPATRFPTPAVPTACSRSGLLPARGHRGLVGFLAGLLGAERILHGADVLAQPVLERRNLVLDLLVGRLLLVDLVLERLDLRPVGTRRGGRRRRRGELDRDVHDRPIEQVPAEAQTGRDQQETAQQATQDQGPARSRMLFGRKRWRVGHGLKLISR